MVTKKLFFCKQCLNNRAHMVFCFLLQSVDKTSDRTLYINNTPNTKMITENSAEVQVSKATFERKSVKLVQGSLVPSLRMVPTVKLPAGLKFEKSSRVAAREAYESKEPEVRCKTPLRFFSADCACIRNFCGV